MHSSGVAYLYFIAIVLSIWVWVFFFLPLRSDPDGRQNTEQHFNIITSTATFLNDLFLCMTNAILAAGTHHYQRQWAAMATVGSMVDFNFNKTASKP
mmetsp:Transcript_29791/g.68756  ORF Transcript_29791/g.68756 Transcript_29791/m.68756 type:complete len:97 (-) Transcript_29791:164-454(-)